MKKIVTLLLLGITTMLLVGCITPPEEDPIDDPIDEPIVDEIDYEGIMLIQPSLGFNKGETPTEFDEFAIVRNEFADQVTEIDINSDSIVYGVPGEYVLYITVEYSDGVTRNFEIDLVIYTPDPADPIIIGVENILLPLNTKNYDLEEQISYFDEGTVVDSGFTGNVNYSMEGYYPISYFVEDDDGNIVSVDAFVIVGDFEREMENNKSKLYEMSTLEEETYFEYELLMYALKLQDDEDPLSPRKFMGHLLSVNQVETLLGRGLREDEVLSFTTYIERHKNEELLYFEKLHGRDLTTEEIALIDLAYDVYHNYYDELFRNYTDVDYDYLYAFNYLNIIEELNLFEIYLNTDFIINNDEMAAINYYLGNTLFSGAFGELANVVEYTEYQYDPEMLEILNIQSYYHHSILDILYYGGSLRMDLDQIESIFGRQLSETEQHYCELYKDYTKHLQIYHVIKEKEELGIYDTDLVQYELAMDLLIEAAMTINDVEDHTVNFIYNDDLSVIEDLIGRVLTAEEISALDYANSVNIHKEKAHQEFLQIYGRNITSENLELLDVLFNLYYEIENNTEYLVLNPLILNFYEVEKVLNRELTDLEIQALDAHLLQFSEEYIEELMERYQMSYVDRNLIAKLMSLGGFGIQEWDIIRVSTEDFFIRYPDANEIHLNAFNSFRKLYVMFILDYMKNDEFDIITDLEIDIMDDIAEIFIQDDFTLQQLEYLIDNDFDMSLFEEEFGFNLNLEQQVKISLYDYKSSVSLEVFIEFFEEVVFSGLLICNDECQDALVMFYNYLGEEAYLYLDDYYNRYGSYDQPEIEQWIGRSMTDDEADAYEIIFDIRESFDIYLFFNQFFQYLLTMEEIDEHFDAFKIVYEFVEVDFYDRLDILFNDDISIAMSEITSITEEQENAGDEITKLLIWKNNYLLLMDLFELKNIDDSDLFLDCVTVLNIFKDVEERIFSGSEIYFPILDLSPEDQAAYERVQSFLNFDQIEEVDVYNFFFQNKFNSLTIEEITFVIDLLEEEGFVIDPSITAGYLSVFSGYDTWVNSFEEDETTLILTFTKEIRLLEISIELRNFNVLVAGMENAEFVLLVEFAYELEEHFASASETVEAVEAKFGRSLTLQEIDFMLILDLEYSPLNALITEISGIPYYELTLEMIEFYKPSAQLLLDIGFTRVDDLIGFPLWAIEEFLDYPLSLEDRELLYLILEPTILDYIETIDELRDLQGLEELTELEKLLRFDKIEGLFYYANIYELEQLDFSTYGYYNDSPFDLKTYLNDDQLFQDMHLVKYFEDFRYWKMEHNVSSPKEFIYLVRYLVLENDQIEDLRVWEIAYDRINIISLEEFEVILNRNLTESEIELINFINTEVAKIRLTELISEKEYREFDFMSIENIQKVYQLTDIYLESLFNGVTLEDLLDPTVALNTLGRVLTAEEIATIEYLFS